MERVKNILSENGVLLGVFFKDENKCIGVYDAEADINIYESFAKEIGSDELLEQLETKKMGNSIIVSAKFKPSSVELENKEENKMKFNLIPDLRFINDRGETFKVNTQGAIIRIGNSVLLKNDFDIRNELDKIFEGAKEIILELEYHVLNENMESIGITTKRVYINTYEVREYYNTEKDKNDMIYVFTDAFDRTKELIEEYRHRQIIESLKEQRSKEIKFIDEATLERLLNEMSVGRQELIDSNTELINKYLSI